MQLEVRGACELPEQGPGRTPGQKRILEHHI